MMGLGVPAGTHRPTQLDSSKPGSVSATVGTWLHLPGSRLADVNANTCSLFDSTSGARPLRALMPMARLPPITSVGMFDPL